MTSIRSRLKLTSSNSFAILSSDNFSNRFEAKKLLVKVYGRNVDLPELAGLPLPEGADGAVALRVQLGIRDGEPYPHDTGMRLWMEGDLLTVDVPEDYGSLATEHLVLDHAVPIGLAQLGDTIIHGAGFERNGVGAVLVGPSGHGKSVTSQYLAANGWRLLSDDAVRIELGEERVVMWPSYHGVRLFDDALDVLGQRETAGALVAEYGTKRRLTGDADFSIEPAELRVVFALGGTSPTVECSPVGSARLLSLLAESAFNVTTTPDRASHRLQAVLPFAERLPGYELRFDRRREALAPLADTIASSIEGHLDVA